MVFIPLPPKKCVYLRKLPEISLDLTAEGNEMPLNIVVHLRLYTMSKGISTGFFHVKTGAQTGVIVELDVRKPPLAEKYRVFVKHSI